MWFLRDVDQDFRIKIHPMPLDLILMYLPQARSKCLPSIRFQALNRKPEFLWKQQRCTASQLPSSGRNCLGESSRSSESLRQTRHFEQEAYLESLKLNKWLSFKDYFVNIKWTDDSNSRKVFYYDFVHNRSVCRVDPK